MEKQYRYTVAIEGVRYHKAKPHTCRKCFFWKNKKTGCVLGTENCYFLAEKIKTPEEKKCEGCPYGRADQICVAACCFRDLEQDMRKSRAQTVREMIREKEGNGNV